MVTTAVGLGRKAKNIDRQFYNASIDESYQAPDRKKLVGSFGSITEKLVRELNEIENHLYTERYGNRIYELDPMNYTSDANVIAQWVASSTSATVGLTLTRLANATHGVPNGVAGVKVLAGSAYVGVADQYARKNLAPVIARGLHTTGANATSLVDANADFVKAGVKVGDVVYNVTDGCSFTVTAITNSTTLAGTFNTGGTDNDFDVNDQYLIRSTGATLDMRPYNFVGFFIHNDVAKAATDYDVRFIDQTGNIAYQSLAADSVTDIWRYIDLELSQFTTTNSAGTSIASNQFDWAHVRYMDFLVGSTVGNDEYVYLDEILLYQKSNGHGPVLGRTMKAVSTTDGMTRGTLVTHAFTSAMGKAITATSAGLTNASLGLCCTTDGDVNQEVEIQVDGYALCECNTPTTLAAGESLAAGDTSGLTVDDGTTNTTAFGRAVAPIAGETLGTQYTLAWVEVGVRGGPTPV